MGWLWEVLEGDIHRVGLGMIVRVYDNEGCTTLRDHGMDYS